MEEYKTDKINRILAIYTRLINGYVVNKTEEAKRYGVNEKSIQRDLERIRVFLEEQLTETGTSDTLVYDYAEKGYRLEQASRIRLSNQEILALAKILLDSRAFVKTEMIEMLDKVVACCVPEKNQKLVNDLIANEKYHYIEPRHQKDFLGDMWEIGQAVRNYNYIEIDYLRMRDKSIVRRRVKPVAIMFSEYYFYVTAFIDDEETKKDFEVADDAFPTIYRIDRIVKLKVLEEHFHVPYKDRFEEGEFRKRVQFMYGGKLQRVRFEYSGESIEAVLDRLPTAKILSEEDGRYVVQAEVFGKGIEMWLRGQGNVIGNVEFR